MAEGVAAATFISFASAGFLATLIGGVLVDRIQPARILATGLFFLLLGMAGTALAPTPVLAHAGMAALGVGHGFVGAVAGTTLARFFGKAHHGAIRGASSTAVVAGAAVGPYLASLLAGAVGDYSTAVAVIALACMPMPILAWTLRRP
jgi:MFS family permease